MYYKLIPLPNLDQLSASIYEQIPDEYKTRTLVHSFKPAFFESNELLVKAVETIRPWNEVNNICIATTISKQRLPIHADTAIIERLRKGNASRWALNIPVHNCVNSYTNFYQCKEGASGKVESDADAINYNDTFTAYDDDDMQIADTLIMTEAALFNLLMPHAAFNDTDEPRVLISVRFKSPFSFEELYED